MQVAYLDHYDSFSQSLIDWLFHGSGWELVYMPYDEVGGGARLREATMPVILSPGPLRPELLPETMQTIQKLLGKVPLLGICLGHQCLGYALGGAIVRARAPFHGSTQEINIIKNSKLINSFSTSCVAAQYNSLVLARSSVSEAWVWAENIDGEVAGILWEEGLHPALGVQFHPESFLSRGQEPLRALWWNMVRAYYDKKASE